MSLECLSLELHEPGRGVGRLSHKEDRMSLKSVLLGGAAVLMLGMQGIPVAHAADPIKVGLIEDISGDFAAIGLPKLHGSMLAMEEINKAGGMMGHAR